MTYGYYGEMFYSTPGTVYTIPPRPTQPIVTQADFPFSHIAYNKQCVDIQEDTPCEARDCCATRSTGPMYMLRGSLWCRKHRDQINTIRESIRHDYSTVYLCYKELAARREELRLRRNPCPKHLAYCNALARHIKEVEQWDNLYGECWY